MSTEKQIQLAAGFLFTMFEACENTPEEAAMHTENVIRMAVEMLYPHDTAEHRNLRNEWILKYAAYLRDSADEMIDTAKISQAKNNSNLNA